LAILKCCNGAITEETKHFTGILMHPEPSSVIGRSLSYALLLTSDESLAKLENKKRA